MYGYSNIILEEFKKFNKQLLELKNDPSTVSLEERILKLREDNDFSGKIFEHQDADGNSAKYIGFKPDIKITARCSIDNKLEWEVQFVAPMKTNGEYSFDIDYEKQLFSGGWWQTGYDSLWKAVAAIDEYTKILRKYGGILCVNENELDKGWYIHGHFSKENLPPHKSNM